MVCWGVCVCETVCGVLGSLCLWDCLILQQGAKILLNCRPNGKPLKWLLDDARAGHQGPTRDGWWWWWCLCILTEQLVEIATRILINLIDFLKLRVHVVRQRRQNTWKSDLFCQLVTEVTVRGFRIALGIIWLIILAFFFWGDTKNFQVRLWGNLTVSSNYYTQHNVICYKA